MTSKIEFIDIPVQDEKPTHEWEQPIKLSDKTVNEFPRGEFPDWIEDFVHEVSNAVQSPLDMSYALAIGVLSISLTRKYQVKLSNVNKVSLNTYTAIIAPSGERKSATFNPFLKPVEDYEQWIQKESADKVAQREAYRSSLEVERKEIENQLKKEYGKAENKSTSKIESLRNDLTELNKELAEHPPIAYPLITVGDITPEKFSKTLAEQDETISIASAESTFFSDFGGAYNSTSRPRQEGILGAFSGDSSKVSRVNELSDGVSLRNPLANVLVMIQPTVLEGVHPDLLERGLLNRFLFFKPKTLVGNRSVDNADIDKGVMDKYNHFIMKMLNLPAKDLQLTLSKEAQEVFKSYQEINEHDLREGNSLHDIVGWGNRLPTTVIKIAGLMHLAENIEAVNIPTKIEAHTLMNAIDLSGFLINQTKSVTQMLNVDEVHKIAEKMLSIITTDKKFKGQAHINARELKAKIFGRDNQKFKDEAINKLADHNYIRKYRDGRKKMIEVNPAILTESEGNQ